MSWNSCGYLNCICESEYFFISVGIIHVCTRELPRMMAHIAQLAIVLITLITKQ